MGFRSQPWVSSHWGQFGRKQTKPLQAAALAQQLWEAVGGSPGLEGAPNPCLGPGDGDTGNCSPESAGLCQPQVPPSWCPGPTATLRPAEEGPLQRAGGAQGSDAPVLGGHWAWPLLAAERAPAPGHSGCCQLWVLVGPFLCSPADGRGDPMPRP